MRVGNCMVEWESESEAIRQLRNGRREWEEHIETSRRVEPPWKKIIYECAQGNTFRGIRKQSSPPSKRFRTWAMESDVQSAFESLIRSSDAGAFDFAHDALVNLLVRAWEEPLSYGQAAKLINLAVRFACESPFVSDSDFERAVKHIHVPLDRCVLLAIRRCIANPPYSIALGSQPTMSTVRDLETYRAIQEYIRRLAQEAGVHPILVDFVAWVETHPTTESSRPA